MREGNFIYRRKGEHLISVDMNDEEPSGGPVNLDQLSRIEVLVVVDSDYGSS